MKKVLPLFFLLTFLSIVAKSQTINQVLKNQIDKIIERDEKNWSISTYKHNVTIKDVREEGEKLIIYGTYDYANWWEGTVSINYTATAKIVLQEVVVSEVCWNYKGKRTCAD